MRRLNTSAGILEVMGAPLTGTDVRAYVMSGGGPRLKNFKLKFGGKRCFLIFPIKGSERRGLVSVEVKNKKGQVTFYIFIALHRKKKKLIFGISAIELLYSTAEYQICSTI